MINVKKIKILMIVIILLSVCILNNEFTLAYLFDKTSLITSVFKPKEYNTNDLTISNKVEHPYGKNYKIPENITFEYNINLGSYYKNKKINTSEGEYTADENGIITLNIKPNSELIINEIDEETKVIITSTQKKAGFSIKDNEEEKEIVINFEEEAKVEFINVYKPLPANPKNIYLTGIKILEGREWQEDDKFEFLLEYQKSDETWEKLGTKTIEYDLKNKEFNKYDFSEIIQNFEFNELKTYKFRLSEVSGELENITYDKTINNLEVVITDNSMDGSLYISEVKGYQNIKVTGEKQVYNIEVTFNNSYKVEEPPKIEYIDKKENSEILENNILINESTYTLDTVISKFDGLDNTYSYNIYDKNGEIQESKVLRTGDYLKITKDGYEYKYSIVVSGDVSGDGKINYLDYVKVYNHIQKIKDIDPTKNELYDEYLLAADMSGDDKISYLDYVKIYNKIKELKGDTN